MATARRGFYERLTQRSSRTSYGVAQGCTGLLKRAQGRTGTIRVALGCHPFSLCAKRRPDLESPRDTRQVDQGVPCSPNEGNGIEGDPLPS